MDFCEVPSLPCSIPEWLQKQFIENTIRTGYGDPTLSVDKYVVSPVTAPGDNYVSELYRVLIHIFNNPKDVSIIIKCLPAAEYNLKFICDAKLFEKEINFYNVTLPSMDLLEIAPKCIHTSDDMLVLEDLSPIGYKMVNRRYGLDQKHCQSAIKALAHLHARSVVLPASELAEQYPETIYHDYDHAHRYIKHSLTSLASVVITWASYERFAVIINRLAETALDQILSFMPRNPLPTDQHLFGLNHGDYWTNNIMFKYNNSQTGIEDVRLLDFQMCRYAPLTLDLQYFLYTSVADEDQTTSENLLLQVYHTEFCNVLKCNNRLTLEQLQADMKRTEFFGFVNACMMLPVVLADPEEVSPDLGNVAEIKNDSNSLNWHHGAQFKKQFQKLLLHFEGKGLFQ